MKCFLSIVFFLSFSVMAGTDIQNGGGGISVNGTVATFYSATLQVYPESKFPIENLSTLEKYIRIRQISNKAKIELLESISDSYGRKYYSVKEDTLGPEVLAKIKAEYHRVTNVPLENLTIFAVTDPKSKITLILPDFYKLTSTEQFSILLHESLWINGRVTSYEKMLEIDKASQIYFQYSSSCLAIYNFDSQLESIFEGRNWALNDGATCEVDKYKDLIGTLRVPVADFLDLPTRQELAKLMIYSRYQTFYDTNTLISNLENDPSRVFTVSRLALINELKKGSRLETVLDTDALNTSAGGPFASDNVDRIAELLEQNTFMIPFNTDVFSINFTGVGTITLTNKEKK